jgi:hypothetical protein
LVPCTFLGCVPASVHADSCVGVVLDCMAGPFRRDSVFGAASGAGHGGVNRILAGTPRQSVIAADSIRLMPPKLARAGDPVRGNRTGFRSYFAIAWKLVNTVSMPAAATAWMSVCAELRARR